jgi:hypothetical protein
MFHSTRAFAYQSIPVTIISGGEVAIMEVEARYDRQSITVSGKDFEIFPPSNVRLRADSVCERE